MSITLATSCGSRLYLKVRVRCGLSRCVRQIRCTVELERPVSRASRRTLQCDSPAGGGSSVLASTRCTVSSSIARGRPERGRSASPLRPARANCARHRLTVGSDRPSSPAMSVLLAPSAARSTIRARSASFCATDGVRSRRRSSASCSGESAIAAAARGTPPPYYKSLLLSRDYWNGALGGKDIARMDACPVCGGSVESRLRFCPWCASPQRSKIVDFFQAAPFEHGKALRVSRYVREGHV